MIGRRLLLLFWTAVWFLLPFVRPEEVHMIAERFHRLGWFGSMGWAVVLMLMVLLCCVPEKPEV